MIISGLLMMRVMTVTVDGRLSHQLMRLLMLVDAVRIEVMRRMTWRRSVLVMMLELGCLRNVVRRRKIGRLVVDRGSHGRIITDPESGGVCHGDVGR